MTEQVGVRFGIAAGALFVLTDVVVVGRLPGEYGVALLLVATTVLATGWTGRMRCCWGSWGGHSPPGSR